MPNLNEWRGMGNVTRDIELKYTPKGTALCDVGLAITRKWTSESGEKQEETTFVEITFFGRQAEILAQYVKKGDPLFVAGRLHLDRWTDKQSGQERSRLKVMGEGLQLLSRPAKREPGGTAPADAPADHKRPTAPAPNPAQDPDLDAEPDHIPFRTRIYKDVRTSKLNRRVF